MNWPARNHYVRPCGLYKTLGKPYNCTVCRLCWDRNCPRSKKRENPASVKKNRRPWFECTRAIHGTPETEHRSHTASTASAGESPESRRDDAIPVDGRSSNDLR